MCRLGCSLRKTDKNTINADLQSAEISGPNLSDKPLRGLQALRFVRKIKKAAVFLPHAMACSRAEEKRKSW